MGPCGQSTWFRVHIIRRNLVLPTPENSDYAVSIEGDCGDQNQMALALPSTNMLKEKRNFQLSVDNHWARLFFV